MNWGQPKRCPTIIFFAAALALAQPGPTRTPQGWLHVERNQLVDDSGQAVLIRGTQLPAVDATGTTLSTIRQRWNMNAVRIPVSVSQHEKDPSYLGRVAKVVRLANQLDLLVILAAQEDDDLDATSSLGMPTERSAEFWRTWAAFFRDSPMVLFDVFSEPVANRIPGHQAGSHSSSDWRFWRDGGQSVNGQKAVGMQALIDAIRSTGAPQVVIAMSLDDDPLLAGFSDRALIADSNVMYEVCPPYSTNLDDLARDQHFGYLSSRVPLLANDWDLRLDENSAECRAIPSNPAAAGRLVAANLAYFDAHNISWTASVFVPGKLIDDFDWYEPTQLYSSVTCGQVPWPPLGMGHMIQYKMWGAADPDIITVNGASGSMELAQGGLAISYGFGMAPAAVTGNIPYQDSLGEISVQITDSSGAILLAPLKYVSDNQINFLVPESAASGPAQLAVVRAEGLGPFGKAFIAPVAPGLFTRTANARGAVIGTAIQRNSDGSTSVEEISKCDASGCSTIPIRVSENGSTQLILPANGFRNAGPTADMQVTMGGVAVRILSAEPDASSPGDDRLVLQLGPELRGLGETDLLFTVDGHVANCVRINLE